MAITFLFCLFLGRFFYIQAIWEDDLHYLALDQWTREIPVVASRGKIVDRNGELLAGNSTAYSVFARPNAIEDKAYTAQFLAATLGVSYEELYEKLTGTKSSEITVIRQAEKTVAERIAGSRLTGVYYARDNKRVYPYSDLACQVLGFTSVDQHGTTGVELYYDKYLAGTNGEILYETDLVGVELEGAAAAYLPAADGLNLRLTLDYRIQAIAEEAMARVLESNDVPRDDLETLNALSRNSLVCDIYEPGSTFKIVTAAADIEEYLKGNPAAISTQYIFSSSRTRTVDGTTIRCWSDHANGKHSNQTLAEALNNSCNPCFVDIALLLGTETFYDYLEAFRFGKTTGVDFAGETLGMLVPESSVRDCDLARIGFGQTIAVSPIQLACAAAAAVNGGYYYTPHLVEEIFSDDGSVREKVGGSLAGRTVSEEASAILSSMLEGVVRDGSGKHAYIEGYRVAGKTGTAQKYENGHIAQGKYVSSFVGYFPADNPQYLALVIVDEPQGSYYGSTVAAPCAGEIFSGIIEVNDIQPFE